MSAEHLQPSLAKYLGYWHIMSRHWTHILVGSFTCLLILTVVIARLPNEYEATTTILVDPQQVPERYVTAAVNSDPGERLNTLTQQILSRPRLQEIMEKFHLYSETRGTLSDEELIQQMREHIRIQVRQGNAPQLSTFTITFQGSKPPVVASVANELASSFIRWNINSREQQVEGTQTFISAELQTAKANLEEQEDKLRVFKMNHLGETPDQTASNLSAIASVRSALQASLDSSNRLEEEKLLLTRVPTATAPPGTPDLPLSKRDRLEAEKRQVEDELRGLANTYSDRYPDVVRLKHRLQEVDNELSSLPPDTAVTGETPEMEVSPTKVRLELIDKELKRMKTEQSQMQAQIESYQAKVDAAPLREQQLVELTRNYDVSKQHYQALLDKSFNIEMAASLEQKQKAERFTVLEPAQVPEKPVKPRRKFLLLLATLFSAALPCILLIGKEMVSGKITTEVELKALVPAGARIVGLIPYIETPDNRRRNTRMGTVAVLTALVLCVFTAWVVWQMRFSL
ncbi:MAG TPA: GNVR domain-containing protein [Candidatus Sulfotelmatobacter sp.]|nr:GNVR domain-containing protein [Candidatus Sulfotelmatobacter sp.]